jgi:hypothetical protein
MEALTFTEVSARHYPSDDELLSRVMRPYKSKNCVYLKEAHVQVRDKDQDQVTATCQFEIPESCYIDDTGHFNSVEFNICYNQMAYYLVAKCVKDRVISPFSEWSLDDFWTRQLGDILITDFRSAFRTQMRGRFFQGELEMTEVISWEASDIRDPLVVIRSRCRYWDEFGGDSHGEVSIAITNPPAVSSHLG